MANLLKHLAVFSLFLPLAFGASAATVNSQYIAGTHYEVLESPVRTSDPKRIEVTEVFWYGCSHCFSFEPMVSTWASQLPEDVNFVRSPAIWHKSMELHARAYYTAKALKVLDPVHQAIFEAMNLKKNKLSSKEAIGKVFVAQGVDLDKFNKTFDSFGVVSATKQADARQRSYHVTGTPEMVVNGKYRINAKMAGGQGGMLKVADYLIELERKSQALAP
ncbi:MAG: thiol:disulfide interchange protein DsbA/DsbL [Gammaproteobacteria bacterium]|nr:thiol:disulfide interchange protein DsbA/DsbL [Gammaproteobacteria bacterium]MBQ0840935.1 thiol:disulfide interchange protein DsbA/DsbL [Gammaproteobacteria bacterium]